MQEVTSEKKRKFNSFCLTGFYSAIVSLFIYDIGFIFLLGLIVSIIGLIRYRKDIHKGRWQGVVGVILHSAYLVLSVIHNHS